MLPFPLNEDGLEKRDDSRKAYKGKKLLEKVGHLIRTAYFAEEDNEEKQFAIDYVWYLWSGKRLSCLRQKTRWLLLNAIS